MKTEIPNRKKVAVRLNLDGETVRMLEELSIKNAGSKSQAARMAIEREYNREFRVERMAEHR